MWGVCGICGGLEISVSGWYREGFGVCSVWEVWGVRGVCTWCVYVGCVRYV